MVRHGSHNKVMSDVIIVLQIKDENKLHVTNTCIIIIIIEIKIILIANEIVYTWGDMLMDKNIQYHFNQVI